MTANPQVQQLLVQGQQCIQSGRAQESLGWFMQACQVAPEDPIPYAHLGDAYALLGQFEDVVRVYRKSLELKPDFNDVRTSLAQTYKCHGRHDEAIAIGKEALIFAPTDCKALESLISAMLGVCEWEGIDELFVRFREAIRAEIASGKKPCSVHPWNAATYPLDAALALDICRTHADYVSLVAAGYNCPPFPHPPAQPLGAGERMRIGYVSSEFCDHPLAHLMGSVFGLHDRSKFEVFVYGLKKGDGTIWAQRVEQSAEHYKDVSGMSSVDIAQQIARDRIHIAVNLNGWTKLHRNEVFSLRPAPLQIQFLGYPATTGASWIDYAIVDPVAAPEGSYQGYSEALVLMPHSFICTDHKQVHMDLLRMPPPSRAEVGLPEVGVVFACMNQLFKVEPWLFDVWCSILRRVPGSVLWLLKSPEAAEPRLRKEAQKRGIDNRRLIFADRADKNNYIRRMKLVDVFLDTPLYNSFTTGADALWAGCPMITMPLERMASRAAASECYATGLGAEMVVNSPQEYEERAVALALDPSKLQSLKQRLQQARLTCPLYDTHMWVRDFERALTQMWTFHASGERPKGFRLKVLPPPSEAERKPAFPQAGTMAPAVPFAAPYVMPGLTMMPPMQPCVPAPPPSIAMIGAQATDFRKMQPATMLQSPGLVQGTFRGITAPVPMPAPRTTSMVAPPIIYQQPLQACSAAPTASSFAFRTKFP
mmetsp:Transcript_20324/g.36949  ORF Transcript_20324/g.36949 Transcript_20324/m.36949 type:complete len:707 (+) Transcript_20324:76-2196(+)